MFLRLCSGEKWQRQSENAHRGHRIYDPFRLGAKEEVV